MIPLNVNNEHQGLLEDSPLPYFQQLGLQLQTKLLRILYLSIENTLNRRNVNGELRRLLDEDYHPLPLEHMPHAMSLRNPHYWTYLRSEYTLGQMCVSNARYQAFLDSGYVLDTREQKRAFLCDGFTVSISHHMGMCERIAKIACYTLSCLTLYGCCCEPCLSGLCCAQSHEEGLWIRLDRNQQLARRLGACCCTNGIARRSFFVYDEETGEALRQQDYDNWQILDNGTPLARRDLREFVRRQIDLGKTLSSSLNSQASYMCLTGPISGFSYVLIVPTDPNVSFCPLIPCCNAITGEPCAGDELVIRAAILCERYRPNMSTLQNVLENPFARHARQNLSDRPFDPANAIMGSENGVDSILVMAQNA